MSEMVLDCMAWAAVAAFYLFGIAPMLGSMFDEFGGYTNHLKIGLTISAVLAGGAALILTLLWAISRISA